MGNSTSRQLWAVGIFTGTIGILMLIIVTITGALAAVLDIPVLKYLGYSYFAATRPDTGFVASMIGFTVGVGFLEELCKALPLYWHYRRSATLDARGAVVWGLATGIGFVVSEGISYSGNFYNGISGGGIYIVRFISCVEIVVAALLAQIFRGAEAAAVRPDIMLGADERRVLAQGPDHPLHQLRRGKRAQQQRIDAAIARR